MDVGKTIWFKNEKKQDKDFINSSLKSEIPKNKIFNISSLIFNIESHKEEVLSNYKFFYMQEHDSLCIVIDEKQKYSDFSKEIMMNLMEFCQKLNISNIYMLICRKNKEYIQLLQVMLTVGFTNDENIKNTKLDDKVYKFLKMNLSQNKEEIEEVDFMMN